MPPFSPTAIAAARRASGLSQAELAVAVGASRNTVVNAEGGLTIPRSDLLGRIADALGVDVGEFFVHAPEVAKTSHGAARKITRGDQAGKPSPAGNVTGA